MVVQNQLALINQQHENVKRRSDLMAPTMVLHGHQGEIFSSQFSSDGTFLASAGYDMQIFLWNVFGECENFAVLKGHKGAIMDLKFNTDSSHIATCSTDKTVRVWDMETGNCIRNYKSHQDFVNSIDISRRGIEMISSASDDGTAMVHDLRSKEPVKKYSNKYQQTAIVFTDQTDAVLCGGIDNNIKYWDMRRDDINYILATQKDTITSLSLSHNGNFLLSNSMDCSIIRWDVRGFVAGDRLLGCYYGHMHNFEKNLLKCGWSPNDNYITSASSDRFAYVWDVKSFRILYKLPGHNGSVNSAAFHPTQSILLSAGSDKRLFLGELELENY